LPKYFEGKDSSELIGRKVYFGGPGGWTRYTVRNYEDLLYFDDEKVNL
jgi:hypothetical protein